MNLERNLLTCLPLEAMWNCDHIIPQLNMNLWMLFMKLNRRWDISLSFEKIKLKTRDCMCIYSVFFLFFLLLKLILMKFFFFWKISVFSHILEEKEWILNLIVFKFIKLFLWWRWKTKKKIEKIFFAPLLSWFWSDFILLCIHKICFIFVSSKHGSIKLKIKFLQVYNRSFSCRWCWFQSPLQYLKIAKKGIGLCNTVQESQDLSLESWLIDGWVEFCYQLLMITKISLLWDTDIWAYLNFWKKRRN